MVVMRLSVKSMSSESRTLFARSDGSPAAPSVPGHKPLTNMPCSILGGIWLAIFPDKPT